MLATVSSTTLEGTLESLRIYEAMRQREAQLPPLPRLAGVHLEGPYFSQKERGAQDETIIRLPDAAEYERILEQAPCLRRWSIACELPGALELGERLHKRGIMASVGHSDATTAQVYEAFGRGFHSVTHLYSGCSVLHRNGPHREGGVVEAAFLIDEMDVEVIADGVHLPPDFLRLIYKIKGPEHIALITDSIRAAVKRVSPEKFLLGEVWEDATTKYGFGHRRTYLLGKGLDSVMNYPFKNAVLDFVKGKPAQQAAGEILSICEHYPAPALNTALNFLSTHDTERALTVIADEPANGRGREWQSGRNVSGEAYEEGMLRLRMAYAIIYTLPGLPCLYYGDEIGMQGYRDPFNRGYYCWDSHEERLKPVLAQLAQLRHSCEAFRTGALRVLRAEGGVLHYQRVGATETAEIIVNRSEHIIVEPLASGKHTEVNPMGFTIVVEENGHNPNHSYYDIQ